MVCIDLKRQFTACINPTLWNIYTDQSETPLYGKLENKWPALRYSLLWIGRTSK